MFPEIGAPETPEEPDEQEQELAAGNPYGEDFRNLPQQLIDAITATIKEFQGQEKFSRRREVLHDRRNRFYERGYQHISWNNSQGAFTLASPGAAIFNSDGQAVQCPTYIDDYNIFFPFQRILISVLTQNLPGVNFQPIDPTVPEDMDKAKAAEDYSHAFDRMNDINMIQTDIVRLMGLSGRTVSWTRTETDGQKFGYNEDGTPKTFQRTTIHGTLETKVSITAKEMKDTLYCFIYDDPDIRCAKDEYDWIADRIKAGAVALGENQYERTARLGVLNGTRNQAQLGDSFGHLVSRLNGFLRPASFTGDLYDEPFTEADEADVNEEGGSLTVGEKLKQLFPDGVRAVYIGDVYACAHPEAMDDHADIQFPYPGDGMFRQAFMDSMVVVQDNFNDMMNGAREEFDTGWGSIWFNANDEDLDAVRSQRAAPNAIRGWKTQSERALKEDIYEEKGPELPATFSQFLQMIQGELPQFMLAAPPAIFGAAMEDQKTASGYAQARSQAMGQLGIIWARIMRMFARIRYQSALAAAESDQQSGQMVIPGKNGEQNLSVDFDSLKKGNFGCYPDEDSSFPESTQQKRATFGTVTQLAGQSPQVAAMLDNPDNVATAKKYWGLDELVLLPAEARDKQLAEIEQLLTQEPIQPMPEEIQAAQVQHAAASVAAHTAGQPEPPAPNPAAMLKSSIPVDELDFHQWEFEKCQEWLSSAARRKEDKMGNQAGVQNVKLHALEHRKFMMMQAMQAAQMAAPPQAAPGGHQPPPAKKPPQPQSGPPPAPAAQPAAPAI